MNCNDICPACMTVATIQDYFPLMVTEYRLHVLKTEFGGEIKQTMMGLWAKGELPGGGCILLTYDRQHLVVSEV